MKNKSVNESQLSPEQQALEKVWEEHLASEFQFKSAEAAINTMVERPSVNHVPVMTGGVGRKQLTRFYDRYFIPQMPPDTQITPVSRPGRLEQRTNRCFAFTLEHAIDRTLRVVEQLAGDE